MINHINIRILQKPKVNPMIYDFLILKSTNHRYPFIIIQYSPIIVIIPL